MLFPDAGQFFIIILHSHTISSKIPSTIFIQSSIRTERTQAPLHFYPKQSSPPLSLTHRDPKRPSWQPDSITSLVRSPGVLPTLSTKPLFRCASKELPKHRRCSVARFGSRDWPPGIRRYPLSRSRDPPTPGATQQYCHRRRLPLLVRPRDLPTTPGAAQRVPALELS